MNTTGLWFSAFLFLVGVGVLTAIVVCRKWVAVRPPGIRQRVGLVLEYNELVRQIGLFGGIFLMIMAVLLSAYVTAAAKGW